MPSTPGLDAELGDLVVRARRVARGHRDTGSASLQLFDTAHPPAAAAPSVLATSLSVQDVCDWLAGRLQMPLATCQSFHDNRVDGQMLLTLTDDDLSTHLHVHMPLHRRKILCGINQLRAAMGLPVQPVPGGGGREQGSSAPPTRWSPAAALHKETARILGPEQVTSLWAVFKRTLGIDDDRGGSLDQTRLLLSEEQLRRAVKDALPGLSTLPWMEQELQAFLAHREALSGQRGFGGVKRARFSDFCDFVAGFHGVNLSESGMNLRPAHGDTADMGRSTALSVAGRHSYYYVAEATSAGPELSTRAGMRQSQPCAEELPQAGTASSSVDMAISSPLYNQVDVNTPHTSSRRVHMSQQDHMHMDDARTPPLGAPRARAQCIQSTASGGYMNSSARAPTTDPRDTDDTVLPCSVWRQVPEESTSIGDASGLNSENYGLRIVSGDHVRVRLDSFTSRIQLTASVPTKATKLRSAGSHQAPTRKNRRIGTCIRVRRVADSKQLLFDVLLPDGSVLQRISEDDIEPLLEASHKLHAQANCARSETSHNHDEVSCSRLTSNQTDTSAIADQPVSSRTFCFSDTLNAANSQESDRCSSRIDSGKDEASPIVASSADKVSKSELGPCTLPPEDIPHSVDVAPAVLSTRNKDSAASVDTSEPPPHCLRFDESTEISPVSHHSTEPLREVALEASFSESVVLAGFDMYGASIHIGDRIEARYRGKGKTFYPGTITAILLPEMLPLATTDHATTFSILYDDGDREKGAFSSSIRKVESDKKAASVPDVGAAPGELPEDSFVPLADEMIHEFKQPSTPDVDALPFSQTTEKESIHAHSSLASSSYDNNDSDREERPQVMTSSQYTVPLEPETHTLPILSRSPHNEIAEQGSSDASVIEESCDVVHLLGLDDVPSQASNGIEYSSVQQCVTPDADVAPATSSAPSDAHSTEVFRDCKLRQRSCHELSNTTIMQRDCVEVGSALEICGTGRETVLLLNPLSETGDAPDQLLDETSPTQISASGTVEEIDSAAQQLNSPEDESVQIGATDILTASIMAASFQAAEPSHEETRDDVHMVEVHNDASDAFVSVAPDRQTVEQAVGGVPVEIDAASEQHDSSSGGVTSDADCFVKAVETEAQDLPVPAFLVGTKIEALYRGRGSIWYTGVVTALSFDRGTGQWLYAISYEDGDEEAAALSQYIRLAPVVELVRVFTDDKNSDAFPSESVEHGGADASASIGKVITQRPQVAETEQLQMLAATAGTPAHEHDEPPLANAPSSFESSATRPAAAGPSALSTEDVDQSIGWDTALEADGGGLNSSLSESSTRDVNAGKEFQRVAAARDDERQASPGPPVDAQLHVDTEHLASSQFDGLSLKDTEDGSSDSSVGTGSVSHASLLFGDNSPSHSLAGKASRVLDSEFSDGHDLGHDTEMETDYDADGPTVHMDSDTSSTLSSSSRDASAHGGTSKRLAAASGQDAHNTARVIHNSKLHPGSAIEVQSSDGAWSAATLTRVALDGKVSVRYASDGRFEFGINANQVRSITHNASAAVSCVA